VLVTIPHRKPEQLIASPKPTKFPYRSGAMPEDSTIEKFDSLPTPPIPQYYRIGAVAERLSLDRKTVLRRLLDDPDLRVVTDRKKGTRQYRTYLVPEPAIQRLLNSFKPHG
jgi:hypothetical protein